MGDCAICRKSGLPLADAPTVCECRWSVCADCFAGWTKKHGFECMICRRPLRTTRYTPGILDVVAQCADFGPRIMFFILFSTLTVNTRMNGDWHTSGKHIVITAITLALWAFPPPRTWRLAAPLGRRRWHILAAAAAAVLAGGAWAYCAGPWHLEVYVCICADVAWLLVFFEDAAFRFCDGLFRAHVQPDFAPAVE